MKVARLILSLAVFAILVLGYAASQYSAFSGTAPEYALQVDRNPLQAIALVILVLSFIFTFVPDKEDGAG